jgi:hypothetical protein
VAITPGYGFLSGYLHVLAQAFVLSAIWIALTWWPAGHLLTDWARQGMLNSHEAAVWAMACALLGLPYVLGRVVGVLLRAVEGGRPHWIFEAMSRLGAFEKPSLWDWTWEAARKREGTAVVIRLKDGSVIEGQYASNSKADFSPRQPRLYLEKAYGFDNVGRRIVYPQGAYVDGSEIVAVQFKT